MPTTTYRNAAGEKLPGTTTIIGRFKDSGALLLWAFGQGKLAEQGKIKSLYEKRDEAADIGTLAHSFVEQHIKTGAEPPPDAPEGARSAFEAYRKWASMTKLEIVAQELPMVSEQHQYGGTPDAFAIMDGGLCLLDWKTSNGVYTDYLIQLAAYAMLWEENNPTKPLTGGFHLCRFSKENGDFAHHYWQKLDEAKEQFLLFRRAFDLDKQLKKRT